MDGRLDGLLGSVAPNNGEPFNRRGGSMKITFESRISGYARIAYAKRDVECQTFEVYRAGAAIPEHLAKGHLFPTFGCDVVATTTDGSKWGTWELRPGSTVRRVFEVRR